MRNAKCSSLILILCLALITTSPFLGVASQESPNELLSISVWTMSTDPTNKPTYVSKATAQSIHTVKWFEMAEEYIGRPIEFTLEWVDQNEGAQREMVYLSTGIKHDVITNDASLLQEEKRLGAMGQLVDITKFDIPFYSEVLDFEDGENRKRIQAEDGSVYGFAMGSVSEWTTTFKQFMYRLDVLQKHNLKPAKDLNELYVLLKALKELYPNSYPYGNDMFAIDTIFWANRVPCSAFFFDYKGIFFDGENYVFAPIDKAKEFRETIEYVHKLYDEELLDPDFLSPVPGYAKAFTDVTFVIGNFFSENEPLHSEIYPDVVWGPGPLPMSFNGQKSYQFWTIPKGPVVLAGSNRWISSNADDIPDIVKLMDYQYSPEMTDLIFWGIEGLTYIKDETGKNHFVDEIMDLPIGERQGKINELLQTSSGAIGPNPLTAALGGFGPRGALSGNIPYYDGENFVSEDESAINFFEFTSLYNNGDPIPNDLAPAKLVSLTLEEQESINSIMNPVMTHVQENLLKFIVGQRNISEYDIFIDELKKIGDIEAAKAVQENALERYMSSK